MNEAITKEFSGEVTRLEEGSRTEWSWISQEKVDRMGEVVIAAGLVADDFRKNPVVLRDHDRSRPIGTNLTLGVVPGEGVIAKTHYPPPPASHSGEWQPETNWNLIQAGILKGKSIGFIPIEHGPPTPEELKRFPTAKRVIRKWSLVEYSCCAIGTHQDATVIAVSKSDQATEPPAVPPPTIITKEEAEKRLREVIDQFDPQPFIEKGIANYKPPK